MSNRRKKKLRLNEAMLKKYADKMLEDHKDELFVEDKTTTNNVNRPRVILTEEGSITPGKPNAYHLNPSIGVQKLKFGSKPQTVNNVLSYGLYRGTREQAERMAEELQAIQRVKEYIALTFGVYRPKWDQDKYMLFIDREDFSFEGAKCNGNITYTPIGFLKSPEECKQLVKACYEDLRTIYVCNEYIR